MTDTVSHQHHRRRLSIRRTVVFLLAVALAGEAGYAGGRATLAASSQSATASAPTRATALATLPNTTLYSAIVERVAPAIVTVRVEKAAEVSQTALPEELRDFFGPQFRGNRRAPRQGGLGSGVVVRPDGHILTNHHVIGGADRIRVELADGRTLPAKLVGADEASDLAVLKVEAVNLPALPFGDSDRMKVGDVVLAFGNPLGIGQTVTMGIVSAKGRATGVGDGAYEDFLQTDAPINQGNSGGALVNLQGELVGINAQIVSPSGGNIGLGFAIPSAMARAVTDQLAQDGVVRRSKLGVTIQPVTQDLADSLSLPEATRGALVSGVEPGSPADHAGVRQGDVIIGLNGKPVTDANALRNQIASTRPESSVTIELLRGGKTESKSVRLVERERVKRTASASSEGDRTGSQFGMAVSPLTPQVAAELELPKAETGLVVTDVDPAGIAASAGIQAGDVITRANDRRVETASALRAAIETRADRPALLLVNRRGASLFVALPRERS